MDWYVYYMKNHLMVSMVVVNTTTGLSVQKKEKTFQMTYQVGDVRYLMKGYGEQLTGGYSIQVEEVSESENAVFCKTRLIGPTEEKAGSEPSYPCIVLKIAETKKPVEFSG